DAARRLHEAHVQRDDIAVRKELLLAPHRLVTIRPRAGEGGLARPYGHLHAERLAIAGDDRADPAVTVDTEPLAAQRAADADLPAASFQRGHLLGNLAHRREHQAPGELGSCVGRRAGMLTGGYDDAQPRAGIDIDVRIDAALADEPQLGQALQKRSANGRAFPDQHQRFRVAQPVGERIEVLNVIIPYRHRMTGKLAEARQRAYGVVIIVQYGDFHRPRRSSRIIAAPFSAIIMVGALVLPEV